MSQARSRSLISVRQSLSVLAAFCISSQTMVLPALAATASDLQWEKLQHQGAEAFRKCEYGDAERLLTRAVLQAHAFPAGDMRLSKSAGELGRLLTVRGRFAEAQPYLEEEFHVKELAIGNADGQMIPSMGSLVHFYLEYGNPAKADPLSERILAFVNGTLSEASTAAKGKVKLQAGMALQGWAGEAAPVARNPLVEWAITCDDIGNLYSARENYSLAERLFKAALDVKSTVLGKQHLSLANSYDSLGSLCLAKHQNEDAESYFRDALAITEKIQPPGNPQVYSRLDKLGRCLIQEGKFAEAEELYGRAQGFWKGEQSSNGSEIRAMYALGSLYSQEKKYGEAARLLGQALQAEEQYQGPDSVSLVPYLQKYSYALYYLGRRSEAEGLRNRARVIQPVIKELTMTAKKLEP